MTAAASSALIAIWSAPVELADAKLSRAFSASWPAVSSTRASPTGYVGMTLKGTLGAAAAGAGNQKLCVTATLSAYGYGYTGKRGRLCLFVLEIMSRQRPGSDGDTTAPP